MFYKFSDLPENHLAQHQTKKMFKQNGVRHSVFNTQTLQHRPVLPYIPQSMCAYPNPLSLLLKLVRTSQPKARLFIRTMRSVVFSYEWICIQNTFLIFCTLAFRAYRVGGVYLEYGEHEIHKTHF